MEFTAKLFQVQPAQTGQGKNGTWKKQEVVFETDGQYPKKICVTVWGDKIDLTRYKPGTPLTVSFDIESREFNGRWYTDVKAWKIVPANNSGDEMPPQQGIDQVPPTADYADDLPF